MVTTRREREAELARASFVDAASHVFAHKGFHGATMDEIARGAGYSPGAIYRYFPSKDAVFVAVVERLGEAFVKQVQQQPPVALGFEDRLRWFLVGHLELAYEHIDFFRAFVARYALEETEPSSQPGTPAACLQDHILEGIAKVMDLGLAEGALRPGDRLEYARILKAIMRACTTHLLEEGGEGGHPTSSVERIIDIFIHGAGQRGDD